MTPTPTCHNCAYSYFDRGQWLATVGLGWPTRPVCGNQPDCPGRMKKCPIGRVCRNYRARLPTPQGETVKTIPLGDGFYTYVDAADFDWLNQWTWCLYNGYAARREKGKLILMHREITQASKGMVVDHLNRNKLDNTRANLWNCTPRENARNRRKRRDAFSRFIGVRSSKAHGKWFVRIGFERKFIHGGYFTDEVEAARAYDRQAVELFGEKARLNFPEEWPPQRRREVHAQWEKIQAKGKKGKGKKEKLKDAGPKAKTAGRRAKAARP